MGPGARVERSASDIPFLAYAKKSRQQKPIRGRSCIRKVRRVGFSRRPIFGVSLSDQRPARCVGYLTLLPAILEASCARISSFLLSSGSYFPAASACVTTLTERTYPMARGDPRIDGGTRGNTRSPTRPDQSVMRITRDRAKPRGQRMGSPHGQASPLPDIAAMSPLSELACRALPSPAADRSGKGSPHPPDPVSRRGTAR